MKRAWMMALAMAPGAAVAQEAGDPAEGETLFDRQCVSCHVVEDPAGEVLAGRAGRVGPNLWGVIGRAPGSVPDFDYSELMVAYGESGAVWDEASLAAYLLDPTGHLRAALGVDSGRSKMAFQVRDEAEAHHLAAYLATFPDPALADAAEAEEAPASE